MTIRRVSVRLLGSAAAALMAFTGLAAGADRAADDTAGLLARYPGLYVNSWEGRPQFFYGVPMTTANDPRIAAETWLHDHGSAFGCGDLSLRFEWEAETDFGKFTVFTYTQVLEGLPVDFSIVKIVVLNAADGQKVISAGAKVIAPPVGGFKPDAVDADAAVKNVQSRAEFGTMPLWSAPEKVVYMGEGDFPSWITPIRAWKFTGEQPNGASSRKFTFFVDAATGDLIHARNEILNIDVTGTVNARATPSPLGNAAADYAGNPPAVRTVPNVLVRINGNNATSAYTNAVGAFTIPYSGIDPVTVDCSVGDGQWVRVQEQNAGQALITASATATPGTPVTLLLNPAPSGEFPNAQINAFIHQNTTHNFFKDRAPTFTALDTALPAKTGVAGTCNAFYDGASTNFYNLGGGCSNTSFSSVVSHEYGHHIVNRLGLAQGGFGEGFGDTMSILQYDDFVVGRYFRTTGGAVRLPDQTTNFYPCTAGEVHACGETLGGVVCKLRTNFGNKYGSSDGLARIRQLHVTWALHTLGGQGADSAAPRTLTEYLTWNDDDGNINNGTPDYCQITNAFAAHRITGAPGASTPVSFSFPDGGPSATAPGAPVNLRVNVAPAGTTIPTPNTGRLFWRLGDTGAFAQIAMTQVAPNQYTVQIPGQPCNNIIQYYVQVGTNSGDAYSPASGCGPGAGLIYVSYPFREFTDDMEQDRGWTVGTTTATTGRWVRADPVGTSAQPEDNHSANGVNCWFTGQGLVGGALGDADVDGGLTTLISPTFDMAGFSDVEVAYWRWYSNGTGGSPYADTFRVDVSIDNGTTWTNAETIGPGAAGDPNVNGGWVFASWRFSARSLTPTDRIKVRFIAEDAGAGSLIEAALDDFAIRGLDCRSLSCPADFNHDGGVDGADVESFFLAWEAGDSPADVNGDGGVDGGDVETFFLAWQAGGC